MTPKLIIDGHLISDNAPPFIIAEIGHNHASELKKAKQMVVTAKKAGASAVKFQTRHPKEVYSPAEYNRVSDNPQWMARKYGEHREKLEFSPTQWKELFAFCKDEGITAFSTPFDFKSADLLYSLGVPAFKIASGDATNTPLISYVSQMGKPMIISTGGCTQEDVTRVYRLLSGKGVKYAFLQCSCIYPAPNDVMNLRVIEGYRQLYPDVVIGLSTHHRSWLPSLAAYALGARIFEHHYTNDKTWKGTDNAFSLNPAEMRAFVDACKMVGPALGGANKVPDMLEFKSTIERRKKVVAARDIPKGTVITEKDFAFKCPGNGIPPYQAERLWGSRALRAFKKDEDIVTEGLSAKGEMTTWVLPRA